MFHLQNNLKNHKPQGSLLLWMEDTKLNHFVSFYIIPILSTSTVVFLVCQLLKQLEFFLFFGEVTTSHSTSEVT